MRCGKPISRSANWAGRNEIEVFMKRKVFCSEINKEVFLTFDIINAATVDRPNQYLIGLISSCSACGNKICKECLLAKALCNQPIDL